MKYFFTLLFCTLILQIKAQNTLQTKSDSIDIMLDDIDSYFSTKNRIDYVFNKCLRDADKLIDMQVDSIGIVAQKDKCRADFEREYTKLSKNDEKIKKYSKRIKEIKNEIFIEIKIRDDSIFAKNQEITRLDSSNNSKADLIFILQKEVMLLKQENAEAYRILEKTITSDLKKSLYYELVVSVDDKTNKYYARITVRTNKENQNIFSDMTGTLNKIHNTVAKWYIDGEVKGIDRLRVSLDSNEIDFLRTDTVDLVENVKKNNSTTIGQVSKDNEGRIFELQLVFQKEVSWPGIKSKRRKTENSITNCIEEHLVIELSICGEKCSHRENKYTCNSSNIKFTLRK